MVCTSRIPAQFVGLTSVQLAANLGAAQVALAQFDLGAKVVTASYAQGDGSKSVTYKEADRGALQQYVEQLAALVYPGQGYGRRHRRRVRYS